MIIVTDIFKQFKLYSKPSDRLKEIIFRRSYHHIHEALKGVSFQVNEGETLGILGKNGAGKSTLLKIITGVLLPDSGSVRIDGSITGLLELGTGFDNDLTGLQNINSNGLLIGMTKEGIEQQRDAIISFSELGEYINEPIRTYSSGMVMRLAFSIAMHANPKCFVIDEALSVGDAHFQQKCMKRIKAFRQEGGALIFVSHDLNAVKMICDKVIVLDQGAIVAQGKPDEAVNHYNRLMAELDEKYDEEKIFNDGVSDHNYGSHKAKITEANLTGKSSGSSTVSCGEEVDLSIDIFSFEKITDLTVGIMIRDRFGQDIYGTNSNLLNCQWTLDENKSYRVNFSFMAEVSPGKYTITIALHSNNNHIEDCYHWVDNLLGFEVAGIIGPQFAGVCRLDTKLCIELIS